MTFRVLIQPPAARDIEAAFDWIARRAPLAAVRWLDSLQQAIASLAKRPRRCGLAAESRHFGVEIRQLLHGRRAHRYRVLFIIDCSCVRVIHVRHWARERMSSDEIELG